MASSIHIPALKPIELIVYSDFNCPWCYVAHKEISTAVSRAKAAHANVPFKLEYRPFQLDPSLPEDKPVCRIACYKKKFGSEARMGSVCQLLKERGKSVGINLYVLSSTLTIFLLFFSPVADLPHAPPSMNNPLSSIRSTPLLLLTYLLSYLHHPYVPPNISSTQPLQGGRPPDYECPPPCPQELSHGRRADAT